VTAVSELLEPNKSRWKCGSNHFAEVQRGNRSLSPAITRTGHLLCSSTFRKSLCSRSTVPMWPTRQLRVSGQRADRVSYLQKLTDCASPKASARCQTMHLSKKGGAYSITSSARASSIGGMVIPRALAVLRLMTSSNFVGCSTGSSAGLAPLNTLSTKLAARRYWSG
jgi:hypothetical protein